MAKEQKTAIELADLIRDRLHVPELRVAVFADKSGWCAKVYASDSDRSTPLPGPNGANRSGLLLRDSNVVTAGNAGIRDSTQSGCETL